MKKILCLCALLLSLSLEAFAFGHTTIVGEEISGGGRRGMIPTVDGLNALPLQKNINSILHSAANDLAKRAGGNATLSYDITLNRPTMFSVVLKAVGNSTVYQGVNIDNTTGKEVVSKDLFYLNDNYNQVVGTQEYVFAETGLLRATDKYGPYNESIPYSSLLKSVNIAEGARYITSYKLTEGAENKTLLLRPGELVALYLSSNPTTGFDWQIANKDSIVGLVTMGNSFYLPSRNDTQMAGSPGTTILFFSFAQPGKYTLPLVYERAWEHNPLRSKNYHFIVK